MFVITRVECVTINTAEFGELPLKNPISNMADNHYLLGPNPHLSPVSTKTEKDCWPKLSSLIPRLPRWVLEFCFNQLFESNLVRQKKNDLNIVT